MPAVNLRLKGRGIPANPPGDFYVVLQIALPPPSDDKAKAAYAAMAAAMPFNPAPSWECKPCRIQDQALQGAIFEESLLSIRT
jgi:DnaJ-class molecular chaperone